MNDTDIERKLDLLSQAIDAAQRGLALNLAAMAASVAGTLVAVLALAGWANASAWHVWGLIAVSCIARFWAEQERKACRLLGDAADEIDA